jgi:hypothetical protein
MDSHRKANLIERSKAPEYLLLLTNIQRDGFLWVKKAIPAQAWTGSQGSRNLRLPKFLDSRHPRVSMLSALGTGRL